ncbi:MAG: GNAT family N-acetyltransferase [Microthrixaceae bacterium]|nr:GNAT family N-acetyltransferase [Microthrixaceae bacterium]
MQIRPATIEDAEAILEIYNHQVLTSSATFDLVPRTLEEHRRWLTDRTGVHAVLVALDQTGAVVGFGALSPYRERAGYATTVEDSVYVAEGHQGQGVGRDLLEHLIEVARKHGFHALMAKIVGGQEQSIGLHRACGFEVVGTEREVGRKFGRWMDVVLMELLL